jgi:hypothetical protein
MTLTIWVNLHYPSRSYVSAVPYVAGEPVLLVLTTDSSYYVQADSSQSPVRLSLFVQFNSNEPVGFK